MKNKYKMNIDKNLIFRKTVKRSTTGINMYDNKRATIIGKSKSHKTMLKNNKKVKSTKIVLSF